ncbi:uncharacterized protein N7484_009887 [Penicillium longicatenatum]|uniref:uncharacterized protein n=1 Tax=Penicillium longicatenatum TaxID=1561947 RepID=UPI0025485938|nr:uncharacterized protein N7484_009887 [Penicillium longicatenatum]KAJ5636574.1 hypothetical protein N7484_009887 [Penicillium longicatenatum]
MTSKQPEGSDLESSALTKLIASASASGNPLSATTIQVLHNLQHQHLWTSLQIHDTDASPVSTDPVPESQNDKSGAPTLISGIPPNRIYTHPDQQLYMLGKGIREDDLPPERLFVIPTAQGQSWSLRRMASAFDAMAEAKIVEDGEGRAAPEVDAEKAQKLDEYYKKREEAVATKEWGAQRLLLAMVDKGMGGDGTVVYYVVQEGEVKPRQN